ncbi:hypothetical protein VNO77_01641 [Canavalia gladiata]|uniref:Transmembrane BAX inhibitor motif containing 4 n=1 Tax=Canavalia gladiata TaxID=3824 RepID=A0AAN9MWD5_CANGL
MRKVDCGLVGIHIDAYTRVGSEKKRRRKKEEGWYHHRKMFEQQQQQGYTRAKAEEFDLEAGETLYPGLSSGENQLRWGFIRKVYGILSVQIVLTTLVSVFTVFYSPINDLLKGNSVLLLVLLFLPFIFLIPLLKYQKKHPHNYIFLGLFTLSISSTVGVTCANTDGKIVLEALILTSGVVSSLTAYAFWASKKGKDFSFLGPILFTCLFTLFLTGMMQMFFPLGPMAHAIYGAIGAIIFSGYIVYDTDNLIKRFTYDEYIGASVTLYLDILNLFLSILRMLREANN